MSNKPIELKMFLAFLCLCLVSYASIIFQTHPANPDAQYIIPTLIESGNLTGYIGKLLNLETLDLQPVRDLSLAFDLLVFNKTGFHISIFHNLVLWSLSAIIAFRILIFLYPTFQKKALFLILSLYLTYPLFTQTLAWGVSRKHLLAYFFTLLITDRWLKNCQHFNFKNFLFITLFYTFAVFSQPIALLWPLWAITYSYDKTSFKLLAGSLIIMIGGVYLNFLYYSQSPLFLSLYSSKTNELQELPDKILGLGHYTFQLLFPYLLSLSYSLGHWSTLVGIALLVVLLFGMIKSKVAKKTLLTWVTFSILPLGIVLSKSTMLYDTYLLLPAFGLLVLICSFKKVQAPGAVAEKLMVIGLVLFMGLSFKEAGYWKNDVLLSERNFENRPDCRTAYDYLMSHYLSGEAPPSPEAKNYLYNYDCGKQNIAGLTLINLQSYMLYFEQDFSNPERLEKLQKLSERAVLPAILLVAFLIREDKEEEAKEALDNLILRFGNTKFMPIYIPLADIKVKPFCEKQEEKGCLRFLDAFTQKPSAFQYK